jgi:hypothetical protein
MGGGIMQNLNAPNSDRVEKNAGHASHATSYPPDNQKKKHTFSARCRLLKKPAFPKIPRTGKLEDK